jgi:hypothetical protein
MVREVSQDELEVVAREAVTARPHLPDARLDTLSESGRSILNVSNDAGILKYTQCEKDVKLELGSGSYNFKDCIRKCVN